MAQLNKRTPWRPTDSTGEKIRGGAGGFHLPQKPGRVTALNTARGDRRKLTLVRDQQTAAEQATASIVRRAINRLRRRAA